MSYFLLSEATRYVPEKKFPIEKMYLFKNKFGSRN